MPRQNRVTPTGRIIATPERGSLMGNRGVLHDREGKIVRHWREKRWIACLLQFKSRRRTVMSPGMYTELFFLDEATSLAAGHRPCAECRFDRYKAFRHAWLNAGYGTSATTASQIDSRMHQDRLASGTSKRTFQANLDTMPEGVFVSLPGRAEADCLLWGGQVHVWSHGGYLERLPRPRGVEVTVLTPASTVAVIRAGYLPEVHESVKSVPG